MKTANQTDAETAPASRAASASALWAMADCHIFRGGHDASGPGDLGFAGGRPAVERLGSFSGTRTSHLGRAAGGSRGDGRRHSCRHQLCPGRGKKDPQQVVIDEVAGQLLTLAFAPLAWKPLLAGFILFRAFDMLKPPPIRRLEKLPEGTGIVVDDLGAGVYAAIVLQLLLRTGILS